MQVWETKENSPCPDEEFRITLRQRNTLPYWYWKELRSMDSPIKLPSIVVFHSLIWITSFNFNSSSAIADSAIRNNRFLEKLAKSSPQSIVSQVIWANDLSIIDKQNAKASIMEQKKMDCRYICKSDHYHLEKFPVL